jgi:endonuclease/exonuclease/phosphatase family metal-dependent hydrolase
VFCLHFGLFESDRQIQIQKLMQRVQSQVPDDAPLIIAGDFNDWRRKGHQSIVSSSLNISEAFLQFNGFHANTFPNFFPVLPLDRVYYRNLKPIQAQVLNQPIWKSLSDHLPLFVQFEL